MGKQRRHRVTDLLCDLGHRLILGKEEVVLKRHAPRRLADSDRAVLLRVEVSALLRLVELSPDRERGTIPPEPSEHVGRTGRLSEPASRRDVGPASRKIE